MKRRRFLTLPFMLMYANSISANIKKHQKVPVENNTVNYLVDDKSPYVNGERLYNLIEKVNNLDSSAQVNISLMSDVCLTRKQVVKKTPFKQCSAKHIYGFPVITKDNVTINGRARIYIDHDLPFEKTEPRLCKSTDVLAYLLCVKGNNFKIDNITLIGNISNRKITRKIKRGYGGEEFGLVLLGNHSHVVGCNVNGFSTDSIIVAGNSVLENNIFSGSLRNQISIVNKGNNKIKITADRLVVKGEKNDFAIRPGSGLHVESHYGKASVNMKDSIVTNVNGSCIRLSAGSEGCKFQKVFVDGDVDIVNRGKCNYGKHEFIDCTILGKLNNRYRKCND